MVALKSFLLGVTWSLSAAVALCTWHPHGAVCRTALFVCFVALFHYLEFLVTAIYNSAETDDDSFILSDSDLHMIYAAALSETVLLRWLCPLYTVLFWLGLVLIVVGQTARTMAMRTAGVSFNHYVQKEHASNHVLVTSGIYRVLRHPSYFGFFWWFIGTQLLLQNPVVAALGCYKLHRFLLRRIYYEENLLVSFFGKDYLSYRSRTRVHIPFIP